MSFIEKDLGFVQTRDQELTIAPFKSIKFQLTRKWELINGIDRVFWNQIQIQQNRIKTYIFLKENRHYVKMCVLSL